MQMYMKRKGRRAKVERNKLEHERTLVQQRVVSGLLPFSSSSFSGGVVVGLAPFSRRRPLENMIDGGDFVVLVMLPSRGH